MPKSLSGHELVGSVEELARSVIGTVERDERDKFKNGDGMFMVGPFTALRIIDALREDGFEISRPR